MGNSPVDRNAEYMKKLWGTTSLTTDYWSLPHKTHDPEEIEQIEEKDEETVDIDQIEETADLDTKEEDPEPVISCENCSKDLTLLLSVTDLNFCPDCGNKLN